MQLRRPGPRLQPARRPTREESDALGPLEHLQPIEGLQTEIRRYLAPDG
jgi:hypothetical protein